MLKSLRIWLLCLGGILALISLSPIALSQPANFSGKSHERIVDRSCFVSGDALIFTDTRLHVPESRLARYSKIRNTSSGEDGLCSVKADPPGFHWLSCYRDIGGNGGYMSSRSDDSRYSLKDVVEAVPGIQISTRVWQGSCKVRS